MTEPQTPGESAPSAPAAPMGLDEFWAEVSALGWGTRVNHAAAAAEVLASRLDAPRLHAMHERFKLVDQQLARAIELWMLQREETLGLPHQLARDLRGHIIGLGEIPFGAAVQGPWRAKHRAERDDYLEGFGRSFELALARLSKPLLPR